MQADRRIKEIKGYPFHYVCENGLIYRSECVINNSLHRNVILGGRRLENKYIQVGLINQYGIRKLFMAHRLIANAFIPNPQNKPLVNHINRIKWDNRVENLEWVTYSENTIHWYEYDKNETEKFNVGDIVSIKSSGFVTKVLTIDDRWIIVENEFGRIDYWLYSDLDKL